MPTTSRKVSFVANGYRSGWGGSPSNPINVRWATNYEQSYVDEQNGTRNPKWRSQVAHHQQAGTVYSRQAIKRGANHGGAVVLRYDGGNPYLRYTESWWGTLCPPVSPEGWLTIDPKTSNLATLRFVRECNKEIRSYRSFVGLGELAETIRAFKSPISSLKKGFQDYGRAVERNAHERLRRVRTVGARRRAVTQAISGTYLEYANGWRPFISDMHDLTNAVLRQLETHEAYFATVKSSASQQGIGGGKDTTALINVGGFGGVAGYRAYRVHWTKSCQMVGQIMAPVSGNSLELSKTFGFTLRDFVPAIWELLPLSYVVNTFVDIGAALESVTFDSSTVRWAVRSSRTRAQTETSLADLRVTAGAPPAFLLVRATSSVTNLIGTRLVRELPVSFMAYPAFRLPGQGQWSKLANFSSLYAQFRSHSTNLWKMIG